MDNPRETILKWYNKGQNDLTDNFIALWIAFNVWYRASYGSEQDRENINLLKISIDEWSIDEFEEIRESYNDIYNELKGKPLQNLTRSSDRYWNGKLPKELKLSELVEFWYRVRNNLFHAGKTPEVHRNQKIISLAYDSLNIFMSHIVAKLEQVLTDEDSKRLASLRQLKDLKFKQLQTDSALSEEERLKLHEQWVNLDREYNEKVRKYFLVTQTH